jgi:selenocysteine-specific elongation factor
VRAAVEAGCPAVAAQHIVANAVQRQELLLEGARLRLPTHRVQFDGHQSEAADLLLKLLDGSGFAPPDLSAAVAEAGAADVVAELEASGQILRIGPNIAMTSAALDRAHALLWDAYQAAGPVTASRARDVLDTTRKYVLPLLAALDQRGCTRRSGDVRIVADVGHHDRSGQERQPSGH